jgi:hypothetical protein
VKFNVQFTIFLACFSTIMLISSVSSVGPSGGTVSPGTPETAPADAAGSHQAQAGNVTYIGITGFSTTQSWQGYFGNVSGTIQLADASDNVLYNWSLAEPEGEVYASTNNSISWANVQCLNFTANGTLSSAGETPGATNLGGYNLTQIENMFNISSDESDGLNETFSFLPSGDGHDAFTTANLLFSAAECLSTKVYSSAGPVANQFEEALLYEPTTRSIIFASILEKGILSGFNNQDNDFEMLVLENGHGTNVVSTTYYFFIELE